MTGNTAAFKIDNLRYDHTGNRLTKVTEEEIGKSEGYPYLASHNTIEYDNNLANGNGNMTKHLDKGISSIQYNFLNLPNQITQNAQVTNYVYRADGAKVKKLFGDIETNYLDGFQYKALKPSQENPGGLIGPDDVADMKLRIIPTSEGYFDAITNQYIYNYTDHLGNIRLSYTDTNKDGVIQPRQYFVSECDGNWNPPFEFPTCIDNWKPGEIVEINNYYPFGLMHNYTAITQNAYQYKYQGQELQETGFYSFKWRNYMPDVARFFNIDPLADKYRKWSPYTFSCNIVINAREIEGLEPHILFGSIDAAAENFGQQYNGLSIIINREYGSTIYSVKTSVKGVESIQFAYSQPAIGDSGDAVTPSLPPSGTTSVADAHTHSAYNPAYDNNIFSGSKTGNNLTSKDGDIGDNNKTGLIGYIATSNGSLQKYDPKSGFISTVSTNLPSDPNDPTRLNNISSVVSPTVTIPPLPTNPPTITSPKIETEIGKP